MNTINLNNQNTFPLQNKTTNSTFNLSEWAATQAQKFEDARFGMMCMYIIIQSCIASIAAMFVLQNHAHIALLSTTAALAMGTNALFIAQGKAKLCLGAFYISVIVNTLFIIFNV